MDEEEQFPQDMVEFVLENLESHIGEDGDIYVHAGHLVELFEVGEDMIERMPLVAEQIGESKNDPKFIAYMMGVRYMTAIINALLNAVQAKHAHEIAIPMDDLLESIDNFRKGETE